MSLTPFDFRECIYRELPATTPLLLAVSGGVDSMVLLDACAREAQKSGRKLAVAHVNHGLRSTAERDQELVRATCKKLNIPVYVKNLSLDTSENVESAARKARYTFFKELLAAQNLPVVCTAHTASDVVETFLMRIVSNKEPRTIFKLDEERKLLRPMLGIFREAVLQYARDCSVSFFDDETNFDTAFLRNKIRQRILPFLSEEFGATLEKRLYARAMAAAADIAALDAIILDVINRFVVADFGSRSWFGEVRQALAEIPGVLHWRLIEKLLKIKLGFNLGRLHSERVCAVFMDQAVGVELPGGFEVRRKNGGIELISKETI